MSEPHTSRPRLVLFRVFVTLLVVCAVAQVTYLLVSREWLRRSIPEALQILAILFGLNNATALVACVLALALAWRGAGHAGARALALFLGFFAIFWGALFSFTQVVQQPDGQRRASVAFATGNWNTIAILVALVLAAAAFLRFSALFPRPLGEEDIIPSPPEESAPPSARRSESWRTMPLRALHARLLSPGLVWGVAAAFSVLIPLYALVLIRIGARVPGLGFLSTGGFFLVVVAISFLVIPAVSLVTGVYNLFLSYQASPSLERRKMLWVVVGFVLTLWAFLIPVGLLLADTVTELPGFFGWFLLFLPLGPLALVLCLTVAVFHSGAFDPSLILRRTTIYGALGILFLFLVAGFGNYIEDAVQRMSGLSGGFGSIVTGGLIAVVVLPLKGRFSRVADRYLPKVEQDADTGA